MMQAGDTLTQAQKDIARKADGAQRGGEPHEGGVSAHGDARSRTGQMLHNDMLNYVSNIGSVCWCTCALSGNIYFSPRA